jgi:hypothetical protein
MTMHSKGGALDFLDPELYHPRNGLYPHPQRERELVLKKKLKKPGEIAAIATMREALNAAAENGDEESWSAVLDAWGCIKDARRNTLYDETLASIVELEGDTTSLKALALLYREHMDRWANS